MVDRIQIISQLHSQFTCSKSSVQTAEKNCKICSNLAIVTIERLILLFLLLILTIGMTFYTSITQLLKVAGSFKYV